MKIILVLFAALSLAACTQSSSSSGNGGSAKAEKLTAEISKDISNFVTNENALGQLVSDSISGANTFTDLAPSEMRDNCKLTSSFFTETAEGISINSYKLSGDKCPILAEYKDKFGSYKNDVNTEWSNSFLVQSKDYQEKYGFAAINVNNKLVFQTGKDRTRTLSYFYTMADGSGVSAAFTAQATSVPGYEVYSAVVELVIDNNSVKYSDIKKYNTSGTVKVKTETGCKFNNVLLTESECEETGISRLLNGNGAWKWRDVYP